MSRLKFIPQALRVSDKLLDLAKDLLWRRALALAGAAVGGSACLYYVLAAEGEAGIVAGIRGVFEAGGHRGWDAGFAGDSEASVERPAVEAELMSLIRPGRADKYAVVVGPGGSGKSTSTRKVVRKLIAQAARREGAEGGAGVIYFTSRELAAVFSLDLARAVGYRTPIDFLDRIRRAVAGETKEQAASPLLFDEPRATWAPMSRLLRDAATAYTLRHGRAPTLVLDAMDLVAKKDPAFFSEVQDFAKACADGRILRVVFVFSDGDALPLLLSSSAESRCDKDQIFEVGDISDADAVSYIRAQYPSSRYGLDELQARELVETVTGGRFTLLQDYGKTARPLEAIRRVLDIDTKTKLRAANVRPTHELFEALAALKCVAKDEAEGLLDPKGIDELLRRNILAVHPDGNYTFNNKHVERCIRGALAESRSVVVAPRG